jgi:hypothetical protein
MSERDGSGNRGHCLGWAALLAGMLVACVSVVVKVALVLT